VYGGSFYHGSTGLKFSHPNIMKIERGLAQYIYKLLSYILRGSCFPKNGVLFASYWLERHATAKPKVHPQMLATYPFKGYRLIVDYRVLFHEFNIRRPSRRYQIHIVLKYQDPPSVSLCLAIGSLERRSRYILRSVF